MAKINYSDYVSQLENYFSSISKLMTEDLVRHIFVMLHNKNCAIEVPYIRTKSPITPLKVKKTKLTYFKNSLSRADLYYERGVKGITDDEKDAVIEFKFHRRTKYSQNCATSKIGSVFGDLNRLSLLKNDTKYLIYVFDKNMFDYFDKCMKPNDPRYYFNTKSLSVGSLYTIEPNPSTAPRFFEKEFSKNALRGFNSAVASDMSAFCYDIELEYCGKIPNVDYYLIAYKVH